MTWVVGMPSWFGYSLGLSDICVTLGDRSTVDCLQKIYPVGRFVALGFSGSVQIGFAMVDRLADLLVTAPGEAWDTEIVAQWWPEQARLVFDGFPEKARNGKSSLMMLSVHPNRDNGAFPLPFAHIFRSPNFNPIPIRTNDAASIGSGTQVDACRETLERLCNDEEHRLELMQMAQVKDGILQVLGLDFAQLLEKAQPKGISPHMHLCAVRRGEIAIAPNDYTRFEDSGPVAFTMPKVATSWLGLLQMLNARGASAEGSVC
jgi:hypothetical protein